MLKMLDNLQLPDSSALKVEAQNWLLHSLLRGDIHRLLDPIMMMLLDPATARLELWLEMGFETIAIIYLILFLLYIQKLFNTTYNFNQILVSQSLNILIKLN